MHWVKATAPDGQRHVYVNLASVTTMQRVENVTAIFLGGIAMVDDGQGGERPQFAMATVLEEPEHLFLLPRVAVGRPPHVLPGLPGSEHKLLPTKPAPPAPAKPSAAKPAPQPRKRRAKK